MDLTYPEDCADWLTSKSKINVVGERIVDEPLSYSLLRRLQCYRLFRLFSLDGYLSSVVQFAGAYNSLASARLKRIPSIIRKLSRNPRSRLSRIADMIGIRVVCESLSETHQFMHDICSLSTFERKIDYLHTPQETGYRAFHIILRKEEKVPNAKMPFVFDVEIQVRSYLQHLWALTSESFGEQVKEGGGTLEHRNYLLALSEHIREIEEDDPDRPHVRFPKRSDKPHIAIVKTNQASTGNLLIDPYGEDYMAAVKQLMAWENGLSDELDESLLLVGVGDLKTLDYTHATFLGTTDIPLPEYLPRFSA